jgi:hypothetical protein
VSDASGSVQVTTVDSLELEHRGAVVLKFDVEGGELAALRGARKTICEAPRVIVVIEAHPLVVSRTGIDSTTCLRFLQQIRPFDFTLCESPSISVSLDRPLFQQVPPNRIFNILCVSRDELGP